MSTLSIQRPRPSIEMRTPAAIRKPGEGGAGELAALGVEDLRLAKARQRLQQRTDAESARSIAVIRRLTLDWEDTKGIGGRVARHYCEHRFQG
jgi:hypothetical protein